VYGEGALLFSHFIVYSVGESCMFRSFFVLLGDVVRVLFYVKKMRNAV
jgi:hypothetical protein